MITNESSSVPLKEAEKQKIALVQNRLTVLQGEVLEATKNLAAIEDAITQGQKNKEYYDNLVESLKLEALSLENTVETLRIDVQESNTAIAQTIDSHAALKKSHDTRKQELDLREDALKASEKDLSERGTAHDAHEEQLHSREARIKKAEKALQTAIESLAI